MATETFTGHRGLDMDEPLIFEQGAAGMSGVDLPGAGEFEDRLGDAGRESEPACQVCRSRRWCAITYASAATITPSMLACIRLAPAP
jgi:hypothetical protein